MGPTDLQLAYSSPWDPKGYADRYITDDLISDIFVEFGDRTRILESEESLRTITCQYNELTITVRKPILIHSSGQTVSMDNTNKIEKKAVIVDKEGARVRLLKGGVLSALNEDSLIATWVSTRLS